MFSVSFHFTTDHASKQGMTAMQSYFSKAKIDCVCLISCCSEKPTSLCSVYIKALFAPLLSANHCTSWLLQSKQKMCLYTLYRCQFENYAKRMVTLTDI